ncbi:MerR family transcriptional regulator [Mycolicibacterium peregrinum]|uniref:MerR family transcriptional regulator n=1 Tax=Mycolicibacterium peregrinum TaxID=43304 RepID=UPI000B095A48
MFAFIANTFHISDHGLRGRDVRWAARLLDTAVDDSKGLVVQPQNGSSEPNPNDKFDDEDYPAYSMGSAARILDTTAAFLRSLDEARLLTPQRSEGGHRRYSRYQLRIAARARELVDQGMALEAACRIIILEDQLAEAHALNAALQQRIDDSTVDEDRRT